MRGVVAGDIFALQAFILTGFPGGLDYFLLVLEGQGYLTRARYKHISSRINCYLRTPFGVVSGYACLTGLYQHWDVASSWQKLVFVLMGVHAVWNACFFGRQAIEANIVDIINRFEMPGGKLRLPKIQAQSGKLKMKSN